MRLFNKKPKIEETRSEFVREVKPLFAKHIKHKYPDDKLILAYFNERIDSLPEKEIINLYKFFQQAKLTNSLTEPTLQYAYLMNYLELSYSLDGWFLKKLLKCIKEGIGR